MRRTRNRGGSSSAKSGGLTPLARQEALWGYLFISPTLIGLLIFVLVPLAGSFLLTFTNWDGLSPIAWNGLKNYSYLIQKDDQFLKVMSNTAYYAFGSVFLTMIPSLFFAMLINQKLRGKLLFRAIYFLPYITMMVAAAQLWRWLYDMEIGLINYLLGFVGVPKIAWLGNPRLAMFSLILMSTWKNMGFMMVLFLAGLQNIPQMFYEAAEVEGAGRWQKFRYITLPLLSPTTFFIIVISIIGSFQVFDIIYIMTRGGPAMATSTIVYYIYTNSFQDFRMGYGSTLAWMLFVVILIVTLIQMKLQRRWVHYG